jgi:hypothetical protein
LLHLCVSVYKSFVTHLDVSANKSAAQAVTVGVLLKIFLVCFETVLFVSVVSI